MGDEVWTAGSTCAWPCANSGKGPLKKQTHHQHINCDASPAQSCCGLQLLAVCTAVLGCMGIGVELVSS